MAIQISSAIFLHIPKTGGTWVTNYFRETGMDHGNKELALQAHINGLALKEIIPHTEDLVFCFVRHPLTWYRSYWEMRKIVADRKAGFLDTVVDLPFQEYIRRIIQDDPGHLTQRFKDYTDRCRFIGKQENLREDLDTLLKYLRFPYNRKYLFKKDRENVLPSNQKYTYELASAIMKAEKGIIEKYNYNYIPIEVLE